MYESIGTSPVELYQTQRAILPAETKDEQRSINLYNPLGPPSADLRPPDNPIRTAFITSIRDVGASDRNGTWVQSRESGLVYMEGLLEATTRACHEIMGDLMEVVGVITDDTATDLQRGKMDGYPLHQTQGQPWIHPSNLRNTRGETIQSLTHHIPSNFRSLPIRAKDERHIQKAEFEQQVITAVEQMGADILISDHLMLWAEDLVRNLRGRILNIHPAITNAKNPFSLRGPVPTQDAIDRANGFQRNGRTNETSPVQQYGWTGATFHLMNAIIDDGPIIADGELTRVYPDDEPQHLRVRNYQNAKIPVFMSGIRHYIRTIFPQLTK